MEGTAEDRGLLRLPCRSQAGAEEHAQHRHANKRSVAEQPATGRSYYHTEAIGLKEEERLRDGGLWSPSELQEKAHGPGRTQPLSHQGLGTEKKKQCSNSILPSPSRLTVLPPTKSILRSVGREVWEVDLVSVDLGASEIS